jgi:hypothetical protein
MRLVSVGFARPPTVNGGLFEIFAEPSQCDEIHCSRNTLSQARAEWSYTARSAK